MPAVFSYFPFDDGPGSNAKEIQWEDMMQFMRTTGVIIPWGASGLEPATGDLAVTAGLGRDVQIAVGKAWIEGFYFEQSDDYATVPLSENNSTDERIDLISARLNTDDNIIEYHVEEGIPAPMPVAPSPVQVMPIWDLPLASVKVTPGAVTINPMDITDLRVISTQDSSASAVTLASAGTGESLVADGTGPLLETKSLVAGPNITLTPSADSVEIEAADLTSTLASSGGAETLVFNGAGPNLEIKGLTAGSNITLTDGGGYVLIESTAGGGGDVTLVNAGTTSLVNDGVGPTLATKGLVAGNNISFSTTAADVTINAAATPSDSPVCIVGLSSNQTVTNTADDKILFDTSIFDPDGLFDSMNNSIVVPEDGIYEIKVNVAWTGDVLANGVVYAYALVNAMTTVGQSNTLAIGNVSVSNNFSVLVELNAMDEVTVTAENNAGVSLDVDAVGDVFPYLSVIKVRS